MYIRQLVTACPGQKAPALAVRQAQSFWTANCTANCAVKPTAASSQLAAVSVGSIDILPPWFWHEFDRWPILMYCTFDFVANSYWIYNCKHDCMTSLVQYSKKQHNTVPPSKLATARLVPTLNLYLIPP